MTHDELLEKLTDYEAHFDQVRDEEKAYNALRAIVELHPMWTDYRYTETSKELVEFCGCCQEKWPCKTIQVIQEELGNG